MSASLVGSEMCIRDRPPELTAGQFLAAVAAGQFLAAVVDAASAHAPTVVAVYASLLSSSAYSLYGGQP
eukprot:11684882-Alexandrium_andersonii.AAC.1